MSNVLVTGATSGLGRRTVVALMGAGHTVVGSMREPSGRNKAVAETLVARGMLPVQFDVTDDSSVDRGIHRAIEAVGHIDVVVNNAGQSAVGLQESYTPDDWQRIFDVNVIGVQRVNRAVLPHFKARGTGLLIQISSVVGRVAIPFQGPYSAAKAAVEMLAEVYRAELSQLGIESVIVEPGAMPTEALEKLFAPSDPDRSHGYGQVGELPAGFVAGIAGAFAAHPEQDPQLVADAIVDLIARPAGQRPLRTIVDRLGLGDAIAAYNEHLESVTREVYSMFHIDHLLDVTPR